MDTLLIITSFGFMALTLMFYGWVAVRLRNALRLTSLTPEGQKKIVRNFVLLFLFWLGITGTLSASGFFLDFSLPPKLFFFLPIPLIVLIIVSRTKTCRAVLMVIEPHKLIDLQVFRVFVELLLWVLFVAGEIPVQMTFEGMNFDILAGLTAPVISYGLSRRHWSLKAALVWNIASLALLVNIVTIAILSTPVPFRYFMNDPANTIVARFPYIWLPVALVPLAYGLHFMSIKQILLKLKQRRIP